MSTTLRVRDLPQNEWERLWGHPALGGEDLPDPSYHRCVVVEDGDEIVAAWFMIQVVHLEPVWIHPDYRNGTLPIRMFKEMSAILDSCTISKAFCFADRPEIADYLRRLGMKQLPFETFLYEVPSCPQPQS